MGQRVASMPEFPYNFYEALTVYVDPVRIGILPLDQLPTEAEIDAMFNGVSVRNHTILNCRFKHKMSYGEIATLIGISEGHVGVVIRYALQRVAHTWAAELEARKANSHSIGMLPGIATGTFNALVRSGVNTIYQVLSMKPEELLKIEGIGISAYGNLTDALHCAGYNYPS